ncbi:MAG: hypothetical protein WD056_00995 [Gemmatimonadota bacterium]
MALSAWGCEGNNLFGPGVGVGPQIIHFLLPPTVMSGSQLPVDVRAVALVRVDSIVVTATGGEFAFRRVLLSPHEGTDFSSTTDFDIPGVISDTLVVLTGVAFDAQGNRSLASVDTVRAIDTTPPTSSVALSQDVVGQGKSFGIEVSGQDNIGLRALGYQLLSPNELEIFRDSVLSSGLENSAEFIYAAGLDLPLGDYTVRSFAHDLEGNFAKGATADSIEVIFIDEENPTVEIQIPTPGTQVAEGDSTLVRVRVRDNDKVSQVRIEGVAFRGDPDLGTFQVVHRYTPWDINLVNASADSILNRYLRANATIGAETVHVIVTATDRQENVGADTVAFNLLADEDPPLVVINAPGDGAEFTIGNSIPVRATVSDPDGFLKSVVVHVRFQGISLRGDPDLLAQEEIVRFTPMELELDPARVLPQQILRVLVPTADEEEEDVLLIVTATDARGNVSADTVTVSLTEAEDFPPSIQILNPTLGSGSALTDSLFVRARLQHPIGVQRVTIDGVAHRGDRDLGTHNEVMRFVPRLVDFTPPLPLDTIVARYLQPVGTESEEVYIRFVAEDAEGNIARDSVLITMGGPSVQIPDLVSGQSVSAGQSLPIRVTASDPAGVNLVRVEITGVDAVTLEDFILAGQDPTAIDLTFDYTLPISVSGTLTIRATARNTNGIFGTAPLVNLTVIDGTGVDNTAPEVRILVQPQGAAGNPNRIEVTDSVRVSVTARDNSGGSGVQQTGYTVRVVRRDNPADTLWITDTIATGGGVSGTVTRVFQLRALEDFQVGGVPFYDPINRPDSLDLDFWGWSLDASGNCGAAVSSTLFQRLICDIVTDGGEDYRVATGETGQRVILALISGETVRLPSGGSIADAAVHVPEGLLFLSNIGLGHLEVFDLATRTFESPILVGSDPWGLAPGLPGVDPNALFVANSGGTNISEVDVAGRMEVDRVSTPNSLLWDVQESLDQGQVNFNAVPFDFSDRPQFVAQDAQGRLVYSTRPTGAAPDGTIRLVDFTLGAEPAVLLFTGHGRTNPSEGWRALANVDRVFTGPAGVFMRTHQPGTPATEFETAVYSGLCPTDGTCGAFNELLADVSAAIPADPLFHPVGFQGRWDIESVGLTDTTFIARAGDGSVVAIGEGATATTGRIFLWNAADETITDAITVLDLVGNAAERVAGVAMNQDGSMGVGRGLFGIYFFDDELRLVGSPMISAGGSGVALHPLHTGVGLATSLNTAYAFVPVGNNTIEIYNTRNYFRSGHAQIRDVIVGPVRSALPFPADNAGFTCPLAGGALDLTAADDECVAVKLYGISSGGGVTVINVTKADIFRDAP